MTPKNDRLDIETLKRTVDYDPATGAFTWKSIDPEWFTTHGWYRRWESQFAGKPAFTAKTPLGYNKAVFGGVVVVAHRAAWALVHGAWPEQCLDHINHDKTDSRIANLRMASPADNARNRSMTVRNKSGVNGVNWSSREGAWQVVFYTNGKPKFLGYFDDLEEAAAVRRKAEIEAGYHPNHGRKATDLTAAHAA